MASTINSLNNPYTLAHKNIIPQISNIPIVTGIGHNPIMQGPQVEDNLESYIDLIEQQKIAQDVKLAHRKTAWATLKNIKSQYFGNSTKKYGVVRRARISSQNGSSITNKCTFDTGASSGNYASADLLKDLDYEIIPCSHTARLGDGEKILHVTEMAILNLQVYNDDGELVPAVQLAFYIVPTLQREIIIGLPDILDNYFDFFITILQNAAEARKMDRLHRVQDIYDEIKFIQASGDVDNIFPQRSKILKNEIKTIYSWYTNAKRRIVQDPFARAIVEQGNGVARTIISSPRFGSVVAGDSVEDTLSHLYALCEENYLGEKDTNKFKEYPPGATVNPWSRPIERCEEEDETPDPLAFGEDILHFMETSVEDSRKEYFELLQKHVSEEMKNAVPGVMDLLSSPNALNCFAPSSWNGIKIKPVELITKGDLPDRMNVSARPIRPALFQHAEKEFQRLGKYFYETDPAKNNSPICSPLVIAPKATAPFIRFCGDYRKVNEYITIPQDPIPVVIHELTKAAKFKVFIDLDMANSFHQIPLSEEFSNILSVKTPWGLVRPKFLPEGVGPASGLLQRIVREIFAPFEEWTIVIFDNFLVLADDYQDAYKKLKLILDRCAEYGVVLKMKKSFIGVDKVNFFGYEVTHGKWQMSQSRKDAIDALQFPQSKKEMQSFLGAALFFHHHIPDYSEWTARLYETTHNDFMFDINHIYDPSKVFPLAEDNSKNNKLVPNNLSHYDYRAHFERFKTALKVASTLHFPDYSLPWVVRCDASEFAVGAVLFQIRTTPSGDIVHEPIAFSSKRFSGPAQNWDAYKREAYAIYHAIHSFSWYLRGKQFVVESDHRNLQWIEASESPIVVRWRALLQSYDFMIVHIPGKDNKVADYMSRQSIFLSDNLPSLSKITYDFCHLCDDAVVATMDRPTRARKQTQALFRDEPPPLAPTARPRRPRPPSPPTQPFDSENSDVQDNPHLGDAQWRTPTTVQPVSEPSTAPIIFPSFEEIMHEVHGDRQLHFGATHTYERAIKKYPGANISSRRVFDYVRECPMCQKTRETGMGRLKGVTLSLKPDRYRRTIGMDHFTISPATSDGYIGCLLLVEHFSHFPVAYPIKSYDAETVAKILFKHFCTYGMFDQLASDPGSAFTSKVVEHLSKYLGFVHKISLVGRHESNGCEGSVKQYLRHLKTLVHDERLVDNWADDTVLPLINFHLASFPTRETGRYTPFELKYGTEDSKYFNLPNIKYSLSKENYHEYIISLNKNIQAVRAASLKAQMAIAEDRRKQDEIVHTCAPGDLVLFDQLEKPTDFLPNKLAPRYLGPYEVLKQVKNDLHVKHVVMRTNHSYHVTRFKPFMGTTATAID